MAKGKRGPRPPFGKGKEGVPDPKSMDAEVPRKLSADEIDERARRLARRQVDLIKLEARKKKINREVNGDMKECRAEIDKLAEEIVAGEEMVRQGDLFAPSGVEAKAALAKVDKIVSEGASALPS